MEYNIDIDWLTEEEERFLGQRDLDALVFDIIYDEINKYLREHRAEFRMFLKEEEEANWDERAWLNKWYERMNG